MVRVSSSRVKVVSDVKVVDPVSKYAAIWKTAISHSRTLVRMNTGRNFSGFEHKAASAILDDVLFSPKFEEARVMFLRLLNGEEAKLDQLYPLWYEAQMTL
jgi:hypothetical protein